MKKIVTVCAAVISFAAFTSIANAATPGTYAGLGLGSSRLETTTNKLSISTGTTSSTTKRGGLGGRLFAGYNFNQYVGVEAGIAHYAKSSYNANGFLTHASIDSSMMSQRGVEAASFLASSCGAGTGAEIFMSAILTYLDCNVTK